MSITVGYCCVVSPPSSQGSEKEEHKHPEHFNVRGCRGKEVKKGKIGNMF